MKYLIMVILSMLVAVASGCQKVNRNSAYSKVELIGMSYERRDATPEHPVFLAKGETALITDVETVKNLVGFFPGLGSRRVSFWDVKFPKDLELKFSDAKGNSITVYTRQYKYWGSDFDREDFKVHGDLVNYLRMLFAGKELKNESAGKLPV